LTNVARANLAELKLAYKEMIAGLWLNTLSSCILTLNKVYRYNSIIIFARFSALTYRCAPPSACRAPRVIYVRVIVELFLLRP
jgi:hypothetical protein